MILHAALLVYETILSVSTEIEVVWSRKVTFAGALHIVNRYAEIAAYVAGLILTVPVSNTVSLLQP